MLVPTYIRRHNPEDRIRQKEKDLPQWQTQTGGECSLINEVQTTEENQGRPMKKLLDNWGIKNRVNPLQFDDDEWKLNNANS
jgi:hypothetical protein